MRPPGHRALLVMLLGGAACTASPTQEVDPVFAATAASGVSSSDIDRWNTAASFGDHAEAGYLDAETDPAFTASVAAGISSSDVDRWNTAASFGDHAEAGYLDAETDPAFAASVAATIDADDVSRWDGHTHDDRYPGRADVYTRSEADTAFVARGATELLNVPSPAFVSRQRTDEIDYLGGQGLRLIGATTAASLYAPVSLPGGATVTGLRCFVRDTDATEDFVPTSRVQLLAAGLPDFGDTLDPVVVVDIETTGAGGSLTFFRTPAGFPASPVIDNAAFQYVLSASVELGGASADFFDPIFRGCQIAYRAP